MKTKNKIIVSDIERSIIKTYKKDIWVPFIKAVKEFNLIEAGDKIAVAISGGKDSLLLTKCLQHFQKISDVPFELEFISMDPGFNKENLDQLIFNCKILDIPIEIKKSDIFKVTEKIAGENPCYMCARMRRGFLYHFAQEKGCNKLALGHHFDDVIETTLLNIFYGAQFKTMVPKVLSENFENMTLIRPLVFIKERDIVRFSNNIKLNTMDCGCTVAAKTFGSKRAEMKELIQTLKKNNPNVEQSIFKSAKNINLTQVYGYVQHKQKKDFNMIFDEINKKDEIK